MVQECAFLNRSEHPLSRSRGGSGSLRLEQEAFRGDGDGSALAWKHERRPGQEGEVSVTVLLFRTGREGLQMTQAALCTNVLGWAYGIGAFDLKGMGPRALMPPCA